MDLGVINLNGTEADPSLNLFSNTRRAHAKAFLENLQSCEDEPMRQRLCQEKRDELLAQKHDLKVEFAFYKSVFVRWVHYGVFEHGPEWNEFTATANEGASDQTRCAKELKKAAGYWGKEIIQHYAEGRGINFAIQLALVAKVHQSFETQALPRLQQLICRRIQLDRRRFKHALERIDLGNAKSWTSDASYVKLNDHEKIELPFSVLKPSELPNGYVFDLHRLIVPRQHVIELPKALLITDPKPVGNSCLSGDETGDGSTKPNSGSYEGLLCSGPPNAASLVSSGADVAREPNLSSSTSETTQIPDNVANRPSGGPIPSGIANACDGTRTGDDSPTGIALSAAQVPNEEMVQGVGCRRSTRIATTKQTVYQPVELLLRKTSRAKNKSLHSNNLSNRPKGNSETSHAQPSKQLGLDLARISRLADRLNHRSSQEEVSATSAKRRATPVLPDVGETCKRLRSHSVTSPHGFNPDALPQCDSISDQAYLAQCISEVSKITKGASGSRGSHVAACLLPILQNCQRPSTDANCKAVDLHLMSGIQAKTFLEFNTPDVPLITEEQQVFQWEGPAQPLIEFFEWIGDDDKAVSVQIPSLKADGCSYEVRDLGQVRSRFLSSECRDDPWNVLDCSCPMPSTLPYFLTGRNCQLLGRIRDQVLNGHSAERAQVSREDWTEWRDIEHWALLSEGGHCTAPHMDSHGLATWITVQQGCFGFVWMSRPTREQCRQWMEDIDHYDHDQKWRYWILKPGQTVYFPSGTIHGVFRLREEKTLALGGHILQWSGINQWEEVFQEQLKYPDCTNEDMEFPSRWVSAVEQLVRKRLDQITRE
ncbi:unnamed protein product [Clonostachys rosea]|uniref:JmjC domain-containing protein n=1 Tax=Bionectria ochroleuca TaxID=29856 RepID=A0ABY6UTF8_BIOOC|nr:unnamed protein product [Clonostachys rosea]